MFHQIKLMKMAKKAFLVEVSVLMRIVSENDLTNREVEISDEDHWEIERQYKMRTNEVLEHIMSIEPDEEIPYVEGEEKI